MVDLPQWVPVDRTTQALPFAFSTIPEAMLILHICIVRKLELTAFRSFFVRGFPEDESSGGGIGGAGAESEDVASSARLTSGSYAGPLGPFSFSER